MMFVKPPYGKVSRFIIDSNLALEKLKKYVYGWLPCYNCEHKLYDHVSYDHLSDPKGVCIQWNPNNDYSFNCGCDEYDFFSYIRYFIPNLRRQLQHNSQGS